MNKLSGIFRGYDMKLAVAWLINSLAYSIIYPFIPIYLHSERGLPMSTVGLVFPVMGLGMIIGPAVSGVMVDRFGRRRVLYSGPLIRGLAFVVLALLAMTNAPFWSFLIALFFAAMLGFFFQNASDAYLVDATTEDTRAKAYGRIRIFANVGWAVGPMLGAFLARTPFSLLFALTALLCICGSGFIWYTCPELKTNTWRSKAAERQQDQFSFIKMLGHREFIFTVIFYFLMTLLASQLYSTLSIYSTEVIGVSKNMLGTAYSFNGLTVILCQLPMIHFLEKLKTRLSHRLTLGAFLYAAGFFQVAFCRNAWMLIIAVIVLTLGETIAQPSAYSSVSNMAPSTAVGRYMGVLGLMRGLAYSIGPYIGALAYQRWAFKSPLMLWGMLGSFGVIAAVGFLMCKTPEKTVDSCAGAGDEIAGE